MTLPNSSQFTSPQEHPHTNKLQNLEPQYQHCLSTDQKYCHNHQQSSASSGAFFNINPPQTRQTLQWNPDDLLELLRTDKYNQELTLQTLGTKTAVLILLATACRKYELKGIDLNHMTFHQDSIQIKLVTLPKNFTKDRPDPEICDLNILANPHNQRLCPVFHIKKYIETTQNIRNTT